MELALFVCLVIIGTMIYLLMKERKESKRLIDKYKGIVDIDSEIKKKEETREKAHTVLLGLKEKYEKGKEVYESLSTQISLLKDDLEIADFGVYEPHFSFDTSEKFKEKIKATRESQKKLIREGFAVEGGESWTVNNSRQKGKTMINRQKKLMLRAFNGECDSFIANVRWNNETRMEERIEKSTSTINKMGETQGLEITAQYVSLKLEELRLTHEYRLKKYEEKEEQRLIREQMREEEKARREYEKALRETEKEEKLLQKAMQKAREEMTKATEEQREKLEAQLSELQERLKEAEEKNQRALSMAQQTKAGHVYVISNIGSFGENVYKIGMTRRLEPLDRVKELGDASVPFKFDVHAMIYSENAPELENSLHKAFDRFRLNHVNRRREYFNISLNEIEKLVLENHGEIEFFHEPEAQEYRESLAIVRELEIKKEPKKAKNQPFPITSDLFD